MLDEEAVEDLTDDVAIVVAEAVDGLKAHPEVLVLGTTFGLVCS